MFGPRPAGFWCASPAHLSSRPLPPAPGAMASARAFFLGPCQRRLAGCPGRSCREGSSSGVVRVPALHRSVKHQAPRSKLTHQEPLLCLVGTCTATASEEHLQTWSVSRQRPRCLGRARRRCTHHTGFRVQKHKTLANFTRQRAPHRVVRKCLPATFGAAPHGVKLSC